MPGQRKNLLQLHAACFLFGTSSILVKLIHFSPIVITLGKVFISGLVLLPIIYLSKETVITNNKKDLLLLCSQGLILAVHLISFFYSIQVSSIAIALLSFATFPIFVTFLEPIFFKERLRFFDIIMALITFSGIALIIPRFELTNSTTQGVCWGLLAGFSCALLTLQSRHFVKSYSGLVISFYADLISFLILIPFIFQESIEWISLDMLYLVILGLFGGALASYLFIESLSKITAQLASITTNLEPLYGIILAAIVLHEMPGWRTVIGGCIILTATCLATLKAKTHY